MEQLRGLLHHALGTAVQLDPITSTLKAPGTKRLKLKYEKQLSNFGFNFNLRSCILVRPCRLTPGCTRVHRDWFQRLKIEQEEPPSTFTFSFNLQPYLLAAAAALQTAAATVAAAPTIVAAAAAPAMAAGVLPLPSTLYGRKLIIQGRT